MQTTGSNLDADGVTLTLTQALTVPANCLTQHYDNARTGWNPHEYKLTVANVPRLKLLFQVSIDGNACAQPLYVYRVLSPDRRVHNTVYVATEKNWVYGIDADTGSILQGWPRSLSPQGESAVPSSALNAGNVKPFIGITSTPVIDPSTNTLFAVSKTWRVGGMVRHYRLDFSILAPIKRIQYGTKRHECGADRAGQGRQSNLRCPVLTASGHSIAQMPVAAFAHSNQPWSHGSIPLRQRDCVRFDLGV